MKIELDMYQTLAVAVLVLMLGKFLRERIRVLDRFCIPAPVIGGVLFAVFTCICYVTGVAEFAFDDTLKEVCMVMFFTSVGFQANLKVLKSGGKAMIVFLGVVIVLIVGQNFIAVGLAKLLGVDALVGLCTGSIPMVGGHGTAGAFGPVLEDFGIQGATTLCTAAATYGLIAGSMMGGSAGYGRARGRQPAGGGRDQARAPYHNVPGGKLSVDHCNGHRHGAVEAAEPDRHDLSHLHRRDDRGGHPP